MNRVKGGFLIKLAKKDGFSSCSNYRGKTLFTIRQCTIGCYEKVWQRLR